MLTMLLQVFFASSPTALLEKWIHLPTPSFALSSAFVSTILTTSDSQVDISQVS